MKIADVIERLISIGEEHTPDEDSYEGTRYLAGRLGLDLEELEDAALDLSKNRLLPVTRDFGPVMTERELAAIMAVIVCEGFLFGVEYERERTHANENGGAT